MCEGNCACNLAAKVSFGVSVVLVLIGSIVSLGHQGIAGKRKSDGWKVTGFLPVVEV